MHYFDLCLGGAKLDRVNDRLVAPAHTQVFGKMTDKAAGNAGIEVLFQFAGTCSQPCGTNVMTTLNWAGPTLEQPLFNRDLEVDCLPPVLPRRITAYRELAGGLATDLPR